MCIIIIHVHIVHVYEWNTRWNLYNLDTIGTSLYHPDYRGVLISLVHLEVFGTDKYGSARLMRLYRCPYFHNFVIRDVVNNALVLRYKSLLIICKVESFIRDTYMYMYIL